MSTTPPFNPPPDQNSSAIEIRESDRNGGERFLRISRWFTWFCLFLFPGILYGISQIKSSTAAVSQWLPSDGEQAVRYEQFLNWFGDDLYLILSWKDCRIEDPKLTELANTLRRLAEREPQFSIRRVTTSTDLLRRLTRGQSDLTRDQAIKRLEGVFVGSDETGMLFMEFSGIRSEQYAPLIEMVKTTSEEVLQLPRAEIKIGGGIYEAVVVDEASKDSLEKFIIPSSIASVTVAWICLGNLRLTFLVFLIAGYCQCLSIAMIFFFNEQLNAILVVMPTLVFMLTVSAGVHMVNYFRDAQQAGNTLPGVAAIRVGWIPCVMASSTTAVGLLSLLVSQLKPVRDFGFFSAIAVILSTVILLLSFPVLAGWFGKSASNNKRISDADGRSESSNFGTRFRAWAVNWILARPNFLSAGSTLLLIGVSIGMFSLSSSVKVESMFEPESQIVQNYSWLEKNIGPLVSMEVVLNFSNECELDRLERAELLSKLQRAVTEVPEVGGTYSALTFIPPLPRSAQSGGLRNSARRSAFRSKLEGEKDQLIDQGMLAVDEQGEHW